MTRSADGARAELLDRALDLFAAYGYDGVGVQQICAAAGVTKPTLYHYFGAKRGLLETLMDERLKPLHAALAACAGPGEDLAARLTRIAEAAFAFAAAERTFYRLYLTLWFAPIRSEAYEVARTFHERHFAAIEQPFRDAAHADRALEGRSRALTAAFLGQINNHIALALNNYTALNAKLAGETTQAFLYGATPRRGAAEPPQDAASNLPIGK